MQLIDPAAVGQHALALLGAERPGPLVGEHVLTTGNGALLVDDAAAPTLLLAMSGGNRALRGDANAGRLRAVQPRLPGMIDAPPAFEAPLRALFPELQVWPRVIFRADAPGPEVACAATVRPLGHEDTAALCSLPDEIDWIADTWGGPAGLAASGHAFGAFAAGELVSVACSFFVGRRYEDIGVVTSPGHRGLGASPACAAALASDIHARGHVPTWSTSPDNLPSLRVAEKLGFTRDRDDRLFVIPSGGDVL